MKATVPSWRVKASSSRPRKAEGTRRRGGGGAGRGEGGGEGAGEGAQDGGCHEQDGAKVVEGVDWVVEREGEGDRRLAIDEGEGERSRRSEQSPALSGGWWYGGL